MNNAWECPRCGTINAPFTPYCHCKMGTASASQYGSGSVRITTSTPYTNPIISRCVSCGGEHPHNIPCMLMTVE